MWYVTKPGQMYMRVRAVRWTGDNYSEVTWLAALAVRRKFKGEVDEDGALRLFTFPKSGDVAAEARLVCVVARGDYLVLAGNGRLSACNPEEFERDFEPDEV